jgi:hypothetical protein
MAGEITADSRAISPGNPHRAIFIIENGGNNGKNERTDRVAPAA